VAFKEQTTRRFAGRLGRGEDVLQAVLDLCREHKLTAGEVRGAGVLETVELAAHDPALGRPRSARRFEGTFELVSLWGVISSDGENPRCVAHATVMRDRDTGIELLGGRLMAARAIEVDLVIMAATSGASAVKTGDLPSAPAATTWADVAGASKPDEPADDEESANPVLGDLIEHPRFGLCEVVRLEGDEYIQVKNASGRLLRLSIDALSLKLAGREGTKRRFRARVA
jgi:predicted DNA-binding protein with PD1-like motif